MPIAERLLRAARKLRLETGRLAFAPPVAYVYEPLDYAWRPFARFVRSYGNSVKRVLFLGMNPGPWGMAQTGVPFGEIGCARDWLGIEAPVGRPASEHPKRPVTGFACPRSEVSGARLWGLFRQRFGDPRAFFAEHYVINYCPLVFMEESSRNLTPDKLRRSEREKLFSLCDDHLRAMVRILDPEWVIGIGAFAKKRAAEALDGVRVGVILHPSPASPAANRGWAEAATGQLEELGLW
jgi:single-strand selective monofunctional uracil DNA glycosylase